MLGGVWLRCVTLWHVRDLDRKLAAGADPMQADELSLRVGQLGSPGTRVRLANALRGAVELANGHHSPLITTRLRCQEIQKSEEQLRALADRLRDGEPLGVQGLAMAARLVNDRSGPLYRERAARSLPVAAFEALIALERGQLTAATTDGRTRRTSPG
jgi:hypothetical protein